MRWRQLTWWTSSWRPRPSGCGERSRLLTQCNTYLYLLTYLYSLLTFTYLPQNKELVDTINEHWGPRLSARLKHDFLLSDRHMDGLRIDLSFDIVKGKPRKKVRARARSQLGSQS